MKAYIHIPVSNWKWVSESGESIKTRSVFYVNMQIIIRFFSFLSHQYVWVNSALGK